MESGAIEGAVFDIRRFSVHDGGGIRTTIFLKGCPLSCAWCHNPEGIGVRARPLHFPSRCIGCGTCVKLAEHGGMAVEEGRIRLRAEAGEDWEQIIYACPAGAIAWDSRRMSAGEALEEALRDLPFYKYGGGVTLSGGEPLAQPEFAAALLSGLKKRGVHTAIETALYAPTEVLEAVIPLLDLIYADFKLWDDQAHRRYTGVSNERIRENIRLLLESPARDRVVVRTPMIPGITADEDNIRAISRFIAGIWPQVSYELLNYNPLAESKYHLVDRAYCFKDNPGRYPQEAMERFAAAARDGGVKHVIMES